jgi:hypothetical protein
MKRRMRVAAKCHIQAGHPSINTQGAAIKMTEMIKGCLPPIHRISISRNKMTPSGPIDKRLVDSERLLTPQGNLCDNVEVPQDSKTFLLTPLRKPHVLPSPPSLFSRLCKFSFLQPTIFKI